MVLPGISSRHVHGEIAEDEGHSARTPATPIHASADTTSTHLVVMLAEEGVHSWIVLEQNNPRAAALLPLAGDF